MKFIYRSALYENMTPCTGSRLNAKCGRITSSASPNRGHLSWNTPIRHPLLWHLPYCALDVLFPFPSYYLLIPNFGQSFALLTTYKGNCAVLCPVKRLAPAQTGQVATFPRGFIARWKAVMLEFERQWRCFSSLLGCLWRWRTDKYFVWSRHEHVSLHKQQGKCQLLPVCFLCWMK